MIIGRAPVAARAGEALIAFAEPRVVAAPVAIARLRRLAVRLAGRAKIVAHASFAARSGVALVAPAVSICVTAPATAARLRRHAIPA